MRSILQDRTLTVGSSGDDTNVGGVLDGSDNASSQDELLPGLHEVEDVDTIPTSLEHVASHVLVAVGGASVGLASDQLGDVVLGGVEAVKIGRAHV